MDYIFIYFYKDSFLMVEKAVRLYIPFSSLSDKLANSKLYGTFTKSELRSICLSLHYLSTVNKGERQKISEIYIKLSYVYLLLGKGIDNYTIEL